MIIWILIPIDLLYGNKRANMLHPRCDIHLIRIQSSNRCDTTGDSKVRGSPRANTFAKRRSLLFRYHEDEAGENIEFQFSTSLFGFPPIKSGNFKSNTKEATTRPHTGVSGTAAADWSRPPSQQRVYCTQRQSGILWIWFALSGCVFTYFVDTTDTLCVSKASYVVSK